MTKSDRGVGDEFHLTLYAGGFDCDLRLSWASAALARGDAGHRTVCEIAWRNLTPRTQAEVLRLLAAHPVIPVRAPRNREFGWACTYPDNVVSGGPQRRSAEHFVNYPRTTSVDRPRAVAARRSASSRGS